MRIALPTAAAPPGLLLTIIVSSLLRSICPGFASAPADALADYVRRVDGSFAWKKVEQRQVDGATAVRLECTSQTWRDHPWRHDLLIVRPAKVRNSDVAFLLITGDGDIERQFGALRTLSTQGGALAAAINRIPNQPLYDGRKEDKLIAYTFEKYLETGDTTWPLLFPMVKSAVRGMDAVQAAAENDFGQAIQRFVVSGASKRGWTTWLSAAVDPRVKAIAPAVIDMLNMKAQTQWAESMYGRQSEQIKPYTDLHLNERMDEPRMVELREWVDPYNYRARYNLPKLLLLGTNDPYWVVDSLRHYWDSLPGPKLVFQTPNAGHDLAGGREARPTLAAFFQMVADSRALPRMTWQFKSGAANSAGVEVQVDPPARAFHLWTATSTNRDFRRSVWSSALLPSNSGTQVVARVEPPGPVFALIWLKRR